MFCRFCGKTLEDNARFCRFCGKRLDGEAVRKVNNKIEPSKPEMEKKTLVSKAAKIPSITIKQLNSKQRRLITSACVLVIGLCLIGITQNRDRYEWEYEENSYFANLDSSGGSSNGNNVVDKSEDISFGNNITDSGDNSNRKESSQSGTNSNSDSGTYSVKSVIDGSALTTEPGMVSMITRRDLYSQKMANANLLLPNLETWSGGKFMSRGAYRQSEGWYKEVFVYEKTSDLQLIDSYLSLLGQYGVSHNAGINYVYGTTDNVTTYECFYSGNAGITKGSTIGFNGGYSDISINVWDCFASTRTVDILYPIDVAFADTGERNSGSNVSATTDPVTTTLKVATEFNYDENENHEFKISGWSKEPATSNFIKLIFNPSAYKTGDTFTKSDFDAQASAGANALYKVGFISSDVANYGTDTFELDLAEVYRSSDVGIEDIRVEVIEKSDSITVLHYYIKTNSDMEYGYFEGLLATEGSAGAYVESDGGLDSNWSPSTARECSSCGGSGKKVCSDCGGSGRERCTRCSNGSVHDGLNGGTKDCLHCQGGWAKCNTCNNRKTVDCPRCNNGVIY